MALQRQAKRDHACGRSSSCEHRWLIWSPSFQRGVPLLLSTFCREIIELTKITCSRNLELCAGLMVCWANGVLGQSLTRQPAENVLYFNFPSAYHRINT